jgi:predicted transcriptional regulator
VTEIVLDKELEERLTRQAERVHQQPSDLAVNVIRQYLEHEEWLVQSIEEGIRAADAGEFADEQEVEAFFSHWSVDEGQVDHTGVA